MHQDGFDRFGFEVISRRKILEGQLACAALRAETGCSVECNLSERAAGLQAGEELEKEEGGEYAGEAEAKDEELLGAATLAKLASGAFTETQGEVAVEGGAEDAEVEIGRA